ncbi:MAG: branched-chain amino acid ABC transporter permease [Clostridium sp.]
MEIFRPKHYYFLFLIIGIAFLFVTSRVLKSRVGRAWMAIREDQVAAKSLGVETSFCKCLNFMYGAFWAGIIGAAYAPFVNYIEASQFTTDTGFNVLAMVVIGGQGTLLGTDRGLCHCYDSDGDPSFPGKLALRDLCDHHHFDDGGFVRRDS